MKQIEKFCCLNCNSIIDIKNVKQNVFFTMCTCGCKMKVSKNKKGIVIKVVGRKNDFVNQNEQLKMKGVKFMKQKEKLELFNKLSKPLMEFIRENGTPHDSVLITCDFAEYNTSQFGMPFETYCNRQQEIQCEICKNPMKSDKGCDGSCRF